MLGPLVLLLQVDEPAGRLDEPFEIVRVLRFRPQPEMLEDVVRFVIALLIPAPKEAEVTRMRGDVVTRALRRLTVQLLEEPGNSLAFVHEKLNLVSAEMTGNRARILFRGRARAPMATSDG